MTDYLFRGKLAELDRDVFDMAQLETERQNRKLIMIPSESTAPWQFGKPSLHPSRISMPKVILKMTCA